MWRLSHLIFFVALGPSLVAASPAFAQYKNQTLGFDAGPWFPHRPSVEESPGQPASPDSRPLRFGGGLRIGGESNFKMNSDRWWFTLRISVGMLFLNPGDIGGGINQQFDALASQTVGDIPIFALEGQMGTRYFFSTDRIRPYLQAAISYTRLLTFADLADDTCTDPTFCLEDTSNQDAFLPTSNIGAVHLQPGLEYVFKRNTAFHVYVDVQRWVRLSAPDNWAPVFGFGMLFYQ